MKQLNGKVAIISGASSGIGRETALLFAEEGASLVVGARRQPELNLLVRQIENSGGRIIALAGDARSETFATAMVELALSKFGGLDIAFNNVGTMGEMVEFSDSSTSGWHETLETNLTSAFYSAKYQLPAIVERGGGSLIFTSSFVGYTIGMPCMAAYATSKAGLIGLTKSLAVEYGTKGIRVNALLPGGTNTDMAKSFADTPEKLDYVRELHALKRLATPNEIAKSALYLASDALSFTTGSALLCDGGISITRT